MTLDGGSGNDYIFSNSNNISMNGGSGNDRIINSWGEDITIEGGEGDDTISSGEVNVLIRGGKGNDSVYGNSSIYEYADGDGNDTISGTPLAINITKGIVSSSVVSGDNLILKVGSGSITILYGANKDIPVVYGDYSEFWCDKRINNYTSNTIVSGGSNADSVRNHVSKVTINAGEGRDTILNENWNGSAWNAKTPDSVLMNGGDGDDVIKNDDGAQATIYGGNGNDNISNAGSKSYINGGNGNDKIRNHVFSVFSVNESNMGEKSFQRLRFYNRRGRRQRLHYQFDELNFHNRRRRQ